MRHLLKFFVTISLALAIAGSLLGQQLLVQPYLQPGNAPTLSKEQKVVIWQTDSIPAIFTVSYGIESAGRTDKVQNARISNVELKLKGKTTLLYRAVLEELLFDTLYHYEVHTGDKTVTHDSFRTRTKKPFTRFAVLGDFGAGTVQQAAIAKQMAQQKPQFVLTTGDNVYQNGLEEEYRKNLFPYYQRQENGLAQETVFMSTIPFYMILGNHDVRSFFLDKQPSSMAYFYYSDLPLNGPSTELKVSVEGRADLVKAFKKNTKPRFPDMSNFSFDYGNVHFTCLDANDYVNPLDPYLVEWLKRDIGKSKADWKLVIYHHPGFNSSKAHYEYQYMRLLSPVFEGLGVNLIINGHVHNYQRSVPMFFAPEKTEAGDQYVVSQAGKVDGKFTLDKTFDGETDTTPNGIIYIVTGAGGAPLYDVNLSQRPELWMREARQDYEPFTVKLVSDRHSFTLIETKGKELTLQQIDLSGKVIDRIKITR